MAIDVEKSPRGGGATGDMKHSTQNDASFIETLEHAASGYAHDRNSEVAKEIEAEEEREEMPGVHHQVRLAPCSKSGQ